MNDLISRKALIEDIHRLKQQVFLSEEVGHTRPFSDKANILECINQQPTAYDVDKVVNELESKMFSAELHGDEWDGQTVNNLLCMGNVYEIVKGGGNNE